MRIGVIDSGVGGLTVLQAVQALISADYLYLMDNRYLPYGEKSELFIRQRLAQLSAHLIAEGAELILIACNTATTQAVAYLRELYQLPFVGTVPAIKPAATQFCQTGFVVLATPATCRSAYLSGLISEFAKDCQVQRAGSSVLVQLAEQKIWYQQNVTAAVATELQRLGLINSTFPAMVLGCTHFPFLAAEIQAALPDIVLLDTADAIARRVKALVGASSIGSGNHHFISTAELDEKQRLRLSSLGFSAYSCWTTPATSY